MGFVCRTIIGRSCRWREAFNELGLQIEEWNPRLLGCIRFQRSWYLSGGCILWARLGKKPKSA